MQTWRGRPRQGLICNGWANQSQVQRFSLLYIRLAVEFKQHVAGNDANSRPTQQANSCRFLASERSYVLDGWPVKELVRIVGKPIGAAVPRLKNTLNQAIGSITTDLRKKRGLRQVDLAKSVEVSVRMIAGMERGEHNLHLRAVEKVARHFGMPLSALIRRAERLQAVADQAEVDSGLASGVDP